MVNNIHIFANIFTGPAPPSGACPSFLFVGELETMISGCFANPKKSKLAGKSTLYQPSGPDIHSLPTGKIHHAIKNGSHHLFRLGPSIFHGYVSHNQVGAFDDFSSYGWHRGIDCLSQQLKGTPQRF